MTRKNLEDLFDEIVENRVERHYECLVEDRSQYVIEVKNSTSQVVRSLYVMDSGHVAPGDDKINDWILPGQVDWFKEVAPNYAYLNNNLFFLHIPLPEYLRGKENILSGELREPNQLISTSRINTGLFSELFFSKQIYGVFCGHNHQNNAEILWEGIHLFYGMFSGKEAKAGDLRGIRYIDLGLDSDEVRSECVFYGDL